MYTSPLLLVLAGLALAKPPSDSRTYAVDYFYGVGPLTEGRMDPIISPGVTSNHVHTVMGGSAFALTMTDETAMTSSCTNSLPKADKSNYWWPKLYFHDPNNGSFIDVELYYAKAYYFSEPTDDETLAFPQGLRMVTGNAMARTWNDKLGQLNIDAGNGTINPVQFVCGTTGADPWPQQFQGKDGIGFPDPNVGGHGVGFPDANCDGYTTPLRYDLHYPSCYNPAVNRDDYTSNMAFPSSTGATPGRQNCPPGWTHTPHLFIEVYWNTPPFAGLWTPGQGSQPFVLASGDPTGYGLHGDFLSGWVESDLQAIIDGCDAGDAGMDQCPNIGSAGGVNDNSQRCNIPPADPQEQIYGVLPQLPGCNPLQYGPGMASIQTANCGGSVTNTDTATAAGPTSAPTYGSAPPASSSAAAGSASASSAEPHHHTTTDGAGAPEPSSSAAAGSASAPPTSEHGHEPTYTSHGTGPEPTHTSHGTGPEPTHTSHGAGPEPTHTSHGTGPEPTHSHEHGHDPTCTTHEHGPEPAHTTFETKPAASASSGGFLEASGGHNKPNGTATSIPGVLVETVTDYVTVVETVTEGVAQATGQVKDRIVQREERPRFAGHLRRHAKRDWVL